MQRIKRYMNYFSYKFTKIDKKMIVFTSFDGHYSDNPKYISEAIHQLDDSYQIVWLLEPKYAHNIPNYIKWYDINDFKTCLMIKSKAIALIDNVTCYSVFQYSKTQVLINLLTKYFSVFSYKKGQHKYTTWHGTPLKKMARDQHGNEDIKYVQCHQDLTLILGNKYTEDIMKHLWFNNIHTKLLGTPRNDLLFEQNQEKIESIKKKLELPLDKKIVLFAPTFRNDGKDTAGKNIERSGLNQLNEIDFEKLFANLNERFGGEWIFVCRFHYHVDSMVDWDTLTKQYQGRLVNGNKFDDMAEYLACTDLLLTDVSSCCLDFALTKKPCLLYFPDYDNYKNKERGLYLDLEKLPFPMSIEFEDCLKDIMNFKQEEYSDNVDKMLAEMQYIDAPHSSTKIAKYILDDIKE